MKRWMLLVVLCCVMGMSVGWGCGDGKTPCKLHRDCSISEKCDPTEKVCIPGCGSDADCPPGRYCEVSNRSCEVLPCPKGGKPTSSGCVCESNKDCITLHVCRADKDDVKRCAQLCQPGDSIQNTGCVCPTGWSLDDDGKSCQKDCPASMTIGLFGYCAPHLVKEVPGVWEKNAGKPWKLACRPGWTSQGETCQWDKLPEPVTPTKVGPQKVCPTDTKDKWDEGYIKRAGLPDDTAVVYVDKQASPDQADGTKEKPFATLAEALLKAPKESVVLVAPGEYAWGQAFVRSLHLVGRCTKGVIIKGDASSQQAGIEASSFSIVIEGMTLLGEKAGRTGISLRNSSGTAVIRDVRIESVADVGILVGTKKVTIEQVEVVSTFADKHGAGVRIGNDATDVTVSRTRLAQNERRGLLVDPADATPRSQLLVKDSIIVNNGHTGIEVSGNAKSVEVNNSEVVGNGKEKPEFGGIFLQSDSASVTLKGNLVEKNIPHGIRADTVNSLTLEGNTIQLNQGNLIFSAAIWAKQANVLDVKKNRILSFGSAGVVAELVKQIKVSGNFIDKATLIGDVSGGVFVSPSAQVPRATLTISIENNYIRESGLHGVYSDLVGELTIVGNTIEKATETAVSLGVNKRGYSLSGTITIEHNRLYAGEKAVVDMAGVPELTVKNNMIVAPLRGVGVQTADGLRCVQCGNVTLAHNVLTNAMHGLLLIQPKKATLTGNIIGGHGSVKDQASTGITILYPEKSVSLRSNLTHNYDQGGLIQGVTDSSTLELSGNVWANHRHVGLSLFGNKGRGTLDGELFQLNGGRHLRVYNNHRAIEVKNSTFSHGKAADAWHSLGWGKSAGNGVEGGSLGLVRWVFSKASLSCEDRALAVELSNGWIARQVRVPHALDVCQTWDYASMRSDEERKKAAPCQKCFSAGKGCRWVWKEAGGDAKTGQGIWKPDDVVCVEEKEFDSCSRSPRDTPLHLQTVTALRPVKGQCANVEQNPCEGNKFCGKRSPNAFFHCGITNHYQQSSDDWGSFCLLKERKRACGDDANVCGQNATCIENGSLPLPMDAFPSAVTLKYNVFWGNAGPDVFLDRAGLVQLEQNEYYFCTAPCDSKLAYRRVPNPNAADPQVPDWKEIKLPQNVTILWQDASHFTPLKYKSQFGGSDLALTRAGLNLLYSPTLCKALSSH